MFVDPTILRTHPHRKVSQLDSGPRDWSSSLSRFGCLKALANLYSAIPEEQPSPLQNVADARIRTPPNQYRITIYLRLASGRSFPASGCVPNCLRHKTHQFHQHKFSQRSIRVSPAMFIDYRKSELLSTTFFIQIP